MYDPIPISVGPTYCEIPCSYDGFLMHSRYQVWRFLKRTLTQYKFEPRANKWVVDASYFYYNKKSGMLYIPRYALDALIRELVKHSYQYDLQSIQPYKTAKVDIPLDDTYQDKDKQTEYIEFLTNPEIPMKALATRTGSGKTYMAIKASSKLGYRTIILTQGLLDQWKKALVKHTLLMPNEICTLEGHQSFKQFLKKDYQPVPVYIASIATLRSLISNAHKPKYKKYMSIDKLFKFLKIGTKITDECHLNFAANCMIDLRLRVQNNIYLSATYMRSDQDGKRIFNTYFPKAIKLGEGIDDKYTDTYAYSYTFGYINPKVVLTPLGYSQQKYEKYLIKNTNKLNAYKELIASLVYSHYISKRKPGHKLIIFCSTVKMCNHIFGYISNKYSKLGINTSVYIGETSEDVLVSADILVSTVGSLGTGNDIPGLSTIINTVSFSAEGLNTQVFGRLRKLPDHATEFVYIYNTDIQSHIIHHNTRKSIYTNIGKQYYEYQL